MSKGSRQRPTSPQFKSNYDNIKWGDPLWKPPKKQVRTKHHHIMPDIAPYRAVAGDRRMITSRSKEREFLKENNCIQVGNEWDSFSKYGGKDHNNPTRNWGRE